MKKILIAEDDRYLINALRVKLLKAGFDVKMALDGKELLQVLEAFTPDLILLDLVLPIIDGFVVLQKLKSKDEWKKIPVLVLTNLSQKEDVERTLSLGVVDYVVKATTDLDGVVNKIKSILNIAKDATSV